MSFAVADPDELVAQRLLDEESAGQKADILREGMHAAGEEGRKAAEKAFLRKQEEEDDKDTKQRNAELVRATFEKKRAEAADKLQTELASASNLMVTGIDDCVNCVNLYHQSLMNFGGAKVCADN
jgi:hypothetical protein